MKELTCDLCKKNNKANGNMELWSKLVYWQRNFMVRNRETRDICLHCLSRIEDLMDIIIKESEK